MSDSLLERNYESLEIALGEHDDYVATITIDRPEARNALNATVRSELADALSIAENGDVRVVVLTGSDGGKAFVAGADVTELRDRDGLEQREVSKRPRVYEVVDELSIPVLARINGHALGGGCELAMACDVRIASTDAKLGQPEINLGIIPGGGGTQRLPRLVGEGMAMQLILSGELIKAPEAKEVGLVDEVYEKADLDDRVYDLAEKIASKSPVAVEFSKKAVQAAARMDLRAGIEYEAELFAQLFETADKKEGVEAFVEDREPEFEGR